MRTRFLLTVALAVSSPSIAAEPAEPVEATEPVETTEPAETDARLNTEQHAVNICALAIPLMNAYVVNYEYLHQGHHGFDVRLEFSPMLDTELVDGTELAAVLNYRYHIAPQMTSLFVGAYARYRYVYGSGKADGVAFDFAVPEVAAGLNIGYRWVFWHGFNAVISGGYGLAWQNTTLTSNQDGAHNAFQGLVDKNPAFVNAPFFGEFSVGYAF